MQEKSATLQHVCSHQVFLKSTFCNNKIWSIKSQSAQAEGTEYKHTGKQISKYQVTKKNKEIKEKSGIQNSLTEDTFIWDQLLKGDRFYTNKQILQNNETLFLLFK